MLVVYYYVARFAATIPKNKNVMGATVAIPNKSGVITLTLTLTLTLTFVRDCNCRSHNVFVFRGRCRKSGNVSFLLGDYVRND